MATRSRRLSTAPDLEDRRTRGYTARRTSARGGASSPRCEPQDLFDVLRAADRPRVPADAAIVHGVLGDGAKAIRVHADVLQPHRELEVATERSHRFCRRCALVAHEPRDEAA